MAWDAFWHVEISLNFCYLVLGFVYTSMKVYWLFGFVLYSIIFFLQIPIKKKFFLLLEKKVVCY